MSGGLPNTTPGPMVHAVNGPGYSSLEIGRAWLCLSQTRYHPPDAREGPGQARADAIVRTGHSSRRTLMLF